MQTENPVIQSIRINPSDKEAFAEISKQLGIPHHESFGKMVSLYKKMYTLEEESPNRMAQAKEVTVLFERLVGIYEEVLSSNDTLKEHMIETHTKALSDSEKKIHHLTEDIGKKNQIIDENQAAIESLKEEVSALKVSLKTAEDSLQKTAHLETAKEDLIESLRHEISTLNQRLVTTEEIQTRDMKKLEKYQLSLDQILFHYDALTKEKEMYVNAVDQMKTELRAQNENHLNLKFSLKEKDLEIQSLKEKTMALESSHTLLKSIHEKEKESLKEEYRQMYEKQILLLKEAYEIQVPKNLENKNE